MEYLDIVDAKDNVIAKETRKKAHKYNLRHREIFVAVFNSEGKILLQQRSKKKKKYPLNWEVSVGEHVLSGESYEEAATRGLKEELGIKADVKLLFYSPSVVQNVIRKAFICHHDGPFNIDRDEIENVEFFSPERINEALEKKRMKFTEGFKIFWKEYIHS
ncbi:NUDIX domain-containing protein [Candidatus Woesearchaeota archaeon]|nr:NUDIX domain-containing protein [Candidatus Woesearchaeota archaeon]